MNDIHTKRNIFEELNYEHRKDGRKYTAFCLFCKQILTNTATQRLKAHRNVCKEIVQPVENDPLIEEECIIMDLDSTQNNSIMDMSTTSDDILFLGELIDVTTASTAPTATISSASSSCVSSRATLSTLSSTSSSSQERFKAPTSKKSIGVKSYIDTVTKKEAENINKAISQFFYGCNIPLSVVEADLFKNMIKAIRPALVKTLPSRKVLSNSLLENEYKRQIEKSKGMLGDESVLLIDGWKNTASNSNIVVTMLHNANGEKAFLNAWDFSIESETAVNLAKVVEESLDLAKNIYDTEIYAVVSDNAANMVKMGKLVNIWHNNCSAHVANLLAKDIVDKKLASELTTIMKEFRHPDLETTILEKGGTKIKTPCETRWNSYRDSFVCFKKNLKFMRECVIDSQRKVKQNVKILLFDDIFIESVNEMIANLDPICNLLNKVQSTNCNVSECAKLWLSLIPPDNEHFKEKFSDRKKQALNIYALTAYYLNPFFKNDMLSSSNRSEITDFLFKNLDGPGLHELDLFLNKKEHFGVLFSKNLGNDCALFWRMALLKYPNISKLALKLMNIPASSAQIERLFSNWNYVHSDLRNKLTFERSKKLIHIYYNFKINNIDFDEDDDDHES